MLQTLADKVRPEHCAVLIVDVQNDFCCEGGAMHREGRDVSLVKAMVPRLAAFVDAARAAGVTCLDPQRLQYRGELVPLRGLARTGAAPASRRLYVDPGMRARPLER